MSRKRPANRSATRKPADPHVEEVRRLRRDPWCAAALEDGQPLEEVRRLYAERNPRDPLDALRDLARELHQVEARRRELVAQRSELVAQLRASGASWNTLAAAAQVARPTLIQAGRS